MGSINECNGEQQAGESVIKLHSIKRKAST